MSVTSKQLRTTHAHAPSQAGPLRRFVSITYAAIWGLAALALFVLMSTVAHWGQTRLDDWRYGRPRTMHLDGFVGHEEEQGHPTHFIALNLQRQVVVLELPGGDAGKVRSLPGPYLFGAEEDLTPVTLALDDIDKDGYNDLLINVRNEQIVYLNKDATFRLPTVEEQQHLARKSEQ